LTNIALLKLQLLYSGILAGQNLPSPLTNPFGLVHLVLPEGLTVSVHRNENGTDSPFTLRKDGTQFLLDIAGGESVPVQWTPPLQSYQQKTSSGVLVADILTVHGDFIAVHPTHACRFGQSGLSCRYCGSSRDVSQHPPFTPRDLVEAIRRHARDAHGIAFFVEDALLVVFRSQLDLSRESLTGETRSSRVSPNEGGERLSHLDSRTARPSP